VGVGKTLLLADDSITIQRVVELTFSHEDIRVVSIGDGKRAAQWITTERPDVVLADVAVPELDGYGLLTHVKKSSNLKHIPVLLLAGAFEAVDEEKARTLGCDGILLKPFEPKQLVARVKELLAEAARRTPIKPPAKGGAGEKDKDKDRKSGGFGELAKNSPFDSPAAAVPIEPPVFAMGTGARTLEPTGTGGVAHEVVSHQPVSGFPSISEPRQVMSVPLVPEPLEPPAVPLWEVNSNRSSTPSAQRPHAPADQAPPAKVSLASAFSALLAAEQSQAPAPQAGAAAPVSEAAIEAIVQRVLTRMTGQVVKDVVAETAERLVREEIEKIKATSE
jgi:CheY-like chemotaxis protein